MITVTITVLVIIMLYSVHVYIINFPPDAVTSYTTYEYTLPTHYPLVIIIKRNTVRNNMIIMCNWRQTSRTFVKSLMFPESGSLVE